VKPCLFSEGKPFHVFLTQEKGSEFFGLSGLVVSKKQPDKNLDT